MIKAVLWHTKIRDGLHTPFRCWEPSHSESKLSLMIKKKKKIVISRVTFLSLRVSVCVCVRLHKIRVRKLVLMWLRLQFLALQNFPAGIFILWTVVDQQARAPPPPLKQFA